MVRRQRNRPRSVRCAKGNNTLVVVDTAGNSSSYTFVLDTNGGETPPDQTPQAPIVVNLDGEAASHVDKTVELPNQFLTEHTDIPKAPTARPRSR